MAEKDEIVWDSEFMENLPPAAQRRLIRIGCDMVELEVCQEYGLEPGSLLADLPDPIQSGLGPEEWRRQVELAALAVSSPLAGVSDPDELWRLHVEEQKEAKDGEQQTDH